MCVRLVFLVLIGDRTRNLWVGAQSQYDDCYEDIYEADGNGNGKVDAEEYVEFSRLRMEHRLQDSNEGYAYDASSTFVDLPTPLQSNFYTLACLCSQFDLGDEDPNNNNSLCCVRENAHISVVTDGSALGVEETMSDEQITYAGLVCVFTNRAIDDVIGTMENVQSPPTESPTSMDRISPTLPPTIPKSATTESPTPIDTISPTPSPTIPESTILPTIEPTVITPTNSPSTSFTTTQTTPIGVPTTQPSPFSPPTMFHSTVLPTIGQSTDTGQIVPTNNDTNTQTEEPRIGVGMFIAIVDGGILVTMVVIWAVAQVVNRGKRRRRQTHPDDGRDPMKSYGVSKGDEEGPDGKTVPVPGKQIEAGAEIMDEETGPSDYHDEIGATDDHDGTDSLAHPTPYFQNDTSTVSGEDAKSIGGISHESDAGWSEAYTSSVGSQEGDGLCLPDSPPGFHGGTPPTVLSPGKGSDFTADENDDDNEEEDAHVVSVTVHSPPRIVSSTTTNANTSVITPASPGSPETIQLLEETSDNSDDLIVHEDFSDDDDIDDNKNASRHQGKQSPEEFRSKVLALIKRVVPEEIDEVDHMIEEFKFREDELIATLLAMEKRTSAQKQTSRSAWALSRFPAAGKQID